MLVNKSTLNEAQVYIMYLSLISLGGIPEM